MVRVLDYGSLDLVESWGSDERIVEAARMSTGKGFLGWGPVTVYKCLKCGKDNIPNGDETYAAEGGGRGHYKVGDDEPCWGKVEARKAPGDEKLLRYLYANKHMTPFEMAGATFEVMAPIMVFREWHRHRVPFSYNEMSARYTPLPDLNYVPTVERMMLNAQTTNRQAGAVKDAAELTAEVAAGLIEEERAFNVAAERFYQKKLKAGVPKELARTHLGVSRYSRMRASSNLRGWFNFLALRDDSHAQWEIREFARALREQLVQLFPRSMGLAAPTPAVF